MPCAEKHMSDLGPPFGGITRIRFKGFVYDVSAIRLPRTFTRSYDHKNRSQSRERVMGDSLLVICKKIAADTAAPTKDFVSFATFVVKDATSRLSPLLCWCGKWPSKRPSLVSKPSPRCTCRTCPCHPTCPQPSPCKW